LEKTESLIDAATRCCGSCWSCGSTTNFLFPQKLYLTQCVVGPQKCTYQIDSRPNFFMAKLRLTHFFRLRSG